MSRAHHRPSCHDYTSLSATPYNARLLSQASCYASFMRALNGVLSSPRQMGECQDKSVKKFQPQIIAFLFPLHKFSRPHGMHCTPGDQVRAQICSQAQGSCSTTFYFSSCNVKKLKQMTSKPCYWLQKYGCTIIWNTSLFGLCYFLCQVQFLPLCNIHEVRMKTSHLLKNRAATN